MCSVRSCFGRVISCRIAMNSVIAGAAFRRLRGPRVAASPLTTPDRSFTDPSKPGFRTALFVAAAIDRQEAPKKPTLAVSFLSRGSQSTLLFGRQQAPIGAVPEWR